MKFTSMIQALAVPFAVAGLLVAFPFAAAAECSSDSDCADGEACVVTHDSCIPDTGTGDGDGYTDSDGDGDGSTDSGDADGNKDGCIQERECIRPPEPPRINSCTTTADCPAGFDCRDLGGAELACAPNWLTVCTNDESCAEGLRCARWPRYCVPPSEEICSYRAIGQDNCPEGYTCRSDVFDLCVDRDDCDEDPRFIYRQPGTGTCRPDRTPCDGDRSCEENATCGPDHTAWTSAEYSQDLFCEPDPSRHTDTAICEDAWDICVPHRDAEYAEFLALGSIPHAPGDGHTDAAGGSGLETSADHEAVRPGEDEDDPQGNSGAPGDADSGGSGCAATHPSAPAYLLLLPLLGLILRRRE